MPITAEDRRPIRVLWLAKGLGPGGMERLLVHHARFGDRDRFHYTAAYLVDRPNSVVPELLATAEVVVCCSKREGAAGALIETMAAGVPIVTVELDGLEGVVVDDLNGLVVARPDLGAGLERVLGDPALAARLGAGGRTFYEEHYSLDAAAARLADTYAWAALPRGKSATRP